MFIIKWMRLCFPTDVISKGQFMKICWVRHQYNFEKKSLKPWVYLKKYVSLHPLFIISINFIVMSRVCQITGKKVMVGNHVSHSNRKLKRKFYPNLVKKKFFLPEEGKYVTLKVSTTALRTINKKGITACVKEARAKGFLK